MKFYTADGYENCGVGNEIGDLGNEKIFLVMKLETKVKIYVYFTTHVLIPTCVFVPTFVGIDLRAYLPMNGIVNYC